MEAARAEGKPSSIPGAGTGLFATQNLQPGDVVVEYTGRILTLAQAKVLQDRTYLKAVTFNRHIDGGHEGSIGRFANDHIDETKHNLRFETRDNRVYLVCTKAANAGEELFVSYGRGHWLFVGSALFLGLSVKEDSLFATRDLAENEVLLCVSSPAMEDVDNLSKAVRFATSGQSDRANAKLKPSPFVNKTVVATASKDILEGEEILIGPHFRLEILPSKISGAGMGAFARTQIEVGETIGIYSGKVLSPSEYSARVSDVPVVARYALKLPDGRLIDPSDSKGLVFPFRTPSVCFINHAPPNSDLKNNCEFVQEPNTKSVIVKTLKTIEKGEELLANYETWFGEDL